MPSILELAEIAYYVYEKDVGFGGDSWSFVHMWGPTSTGFRGGIAMNDSGEAIVAFKGTALGTKSGWGDLTADLKLGAVVRPKQATDAKKLFDYAAATYSGSITVCGHSLGGALAQYIGVESKVNFSSFNGPGIKRWLKSGGWNKGACFNVLGDIIGFYGNHAGTVVTLYGGLLDDKHSMATVFEAVKKKYKNNETLRNVMKP